METVGCFGDKIGISSRLDDNLTQIIRDSHGGAPRFHIVELDWRLKMKKIVAALVGIALIAPVAAEARPNNHGHGMSQMARQDGNWHRFRKGERFDRNRAQNYRVVDYRTYRTHLRAPPRGYHWVQSGNDALLVAVTSGVVASVVAGLFH